MASRASKETILQALNTWSAGPGANVLHQLRPDKNCFYVPNKGLFPHVNWPHRKSLDCVGAHEDALTGRASVYWPLRGHIMCAACSSTWHVLINNIVPKNETVSLHGSLIKVERRNNSFSTGPPTRLSSHFLSNHISAYLLLMAVGFPYFIEIIMFPTHCY